MSGILTVVNDTYFKLSTQQAADLPPNQKYKVSSGQQFTYSSVDPGQYSGHYKVHLLPALKNSYWPNGVQTWYVYALDVQLKDSGSHCARVIVSDGLNVRQAAGTQSTIVASIAYGTIVSLTGAQQTIGERIWSQINSPYQGWISSSNQGTSNLESANCPVLAQEADSREVQLQTGAK